MNVSVSSWIRAETDSGAGPKRHRVMRKLEVENRILSSSIPLYHYHIKYLEMFTENKL